MTDIERLESKIDDLTTMVYGIKTDTCVRLSVLEQASITMSSRVLEYESELKTYKLSQENIIAKIIASIQPMTNLRWAMIQVPSLIAVTGSIIAILKVFRII